ncbi:MAG: hypothetical protein HYS27_03800 [Deltaproteobacteria bacterium]|nr:hypothetical protein [Deltaproteobacteria bacterium]
MMVLAAAVWLAALPADDIARAHELIGALEYDEALALGRAIAADPSADEAEAREGRLIAGYCLAAVGRVSDAEEQFHAAVAEDVRIEAGFPMEHRVQYLLDAARAEVQRERERRAAAARAALALEIDLIVVRPSTIVGGERAFFDVRVRGASAAKVRSLTLLFRRPHDQEFFSLPCEPGSEGSWRGQVGGVYTASTEAYALQWLVVASDDVGQLTSYGSREAPQLLPVAAGSNVARDLRARERLPPLTRLFYVVLGAPAAVTLATAATVWASYAIDDVDPLRVGPDDRVAGILTVLAVPPVMTAVEYATTAFLLDAESSFWPAAIVGGLGMVADIAVLIAVVRRASLTEFQAALAGDGGLYTPEAVAAVGFAMLALGAAYVTPVAMVVWDIGAEGFE